MTSPVSQSYAPPQNQQRPLIATELVKDPVCETYVEKTTAIFRNSHYFCSETCAAKYKEKAA
jgi:YHS domain-containing protein